MTDKLDYFGKYEHLLQGRYPTMRMALNIIHQREKEPTIVETGCMRGFQDWGGGMSTYLFAEYIKEFGGYFHSVDNNPENVALAQYACQGLPADIVLSDSVEYLAKTPDLIDFLYLDSFDMGDSAKQARESSNHQLKEIETAWPKLRATAVVLLDDTNFIGMGKAGLSRAFLKQMGCIELYKYQQSLWLKI